MDPSHSSTSTAPSPQKGDGTIPAPSPITHPTPGPPPKPAGAPDAPSSNSAVSDAPPKLEPPQYQFAREQSPTREPDAYTLMPATNSEVDEVSNMFVTANSKDADVGAFEMDDSTQDEALLKV